MRPGPAALRIALCAALLCAGLVPPAGGQAGTDTAGTPLDPATSTIEIRLEADGDAAFQVSTTFRLDSEEEVAAFESLAGAFTANGSEVGFSVAPFREAAASVETATGREMAIERVRHEVVRSNDSDGRMGTLALRFVWTEFARVDGDRLYVDDAFNTTTGSWLPRLDEGQRLVIGAPEDYLVETASFPVRDGAISVAGPRTFGPGELSFTFRRVNPPSTSTTSPGGTNGSADASTSPPASPSPDDPGPGEEILPLLGGVVVALAAVGLGLYAASRRERDDGDVAAAGDGDDDGGAPPSGREPGHGADGRDGSDSGVGVDANSDPDADGDGDADSGPSGEGDAVGGGVDEALLSDEERVERLLRENGGRMKQATIVDETGWSNAKVSQLLSSMAEAGRVDKLRVGRENLISLPEDGNGDGPGPGPD